MHTSWQTSVMTLAVKSLSSLCLKVGRPPVGQHRAWSTVKDLPHTHLVGRCDGCRLYRRHKASLNAPLCKLKPCSLMCRAVSHVDAPFSLAKIVARCRWQLRFAFR